MAKIDNEYVTIFTDIDGTLIEQVKFEDLDPNKANVLGQATFLRAYYYFELVKFFGDVPLAVDQRLLFGDQNTIDRTPAAEVYAQIELDLIFAAVGLAADAVLTQIASSKS